MTETQSFATEVINIVPIDSVCLIQAPSLENSQYKKLVIVSSYAYYEQIILTTENKTLLKWLIANEAVEEYFQKMEIKFNGKRLFEGFDGMEIGTISKALELSDSFTKSYIDTQICLISDEW